MFFHVQKLINEIVADEPDPAAANILQEGLEEKAPQVLGRAVSFPKRC